MILRTTHASDNEMPRLFIALICATPILMAVAPLSFSAKPLVWQMFVRTHQFAVLLVELLAVFILLFNGGSAVRGWKMLPLQTKWAILILLMTSTYVSFQPPTDHFSATVGLARVALAGLLAMALLGSTTFNSKSWRLFWWATGLGSVAYFAIFAVYVTTNSLAVAQWASPFPGFDNIRHVAVLGLIGFGGGLGFLLLAEKEKEKTACFAATIFCGIPALTFVLWTGSRGPLVAIMCTTLCSFLIFADKRRTIAIYTAICFGFSIALASTLPLPNPIYGVLQAFGLADVTAQNLNVASSGRLDLWQYTFGEALKRPIFGWGINQFHHYLPDNRDQFYHPHNYPIQLLFASGFAGVMLFLVAVTAFVLQRIRSVNGDCRRFNGVVLIALLLYSLYDGILYFSYPTMMFTIVFIGCFQQAPAHEKLD